MHRFEDFVQLAANRTITNCFNIFKAAATPVTSPLKLLQSVLLKVDAACQEQLNGSLSHSEMIHKFTFFREYFRASTDYHQKYVYHYLSNIAMLPASQQKNDLMFGVTLFIDNEWQFAIETISGNMRELNNNGTLLLQN